MQRWYASHPHPFVKRPCDLAGGDNAPTRPACASLLYGLYIDSRFTLYASFPRSVALTQLRCTLRAVTSSLRDLHPQVCAHAGRTKKPRKDLRGLERRWRALIRADTALDNLAYIMPSMPPMPPPGIAGAALSAFGASAIMHSVVSIKAATDAAFCSAVRVTLVGSKMPISIMSP